MTLRILKNIEFIIRPKKGRIRISADGKIKYNSKVEYKSKDKPDGNEVDGNEFRDNKITEEKNHIIMSKSKKW